MKTQESVIKKPLTEKHLEQLDGARMRLYTLKRIIDANVRNELLTDADYLHGLLLTLRDGIAFCDDAIDLVVVEVQGYKD